MRLRWALGTQERSHCGEQSPHKAGGEEGGAQALRASTQLVPAGDKELLAAQHEVAFGRHGHKALRSAGVGRGLCRYQNREQEHSAPSRPHVMEAVIDEGPSGLRRVDKAGRCLGGLGWFGGPSLEQASKGMARVIKGPYPFSESNCVLPYGSS